MGVPSDTFESYSAVGNREDLADRIYNIAPTDTPGMSSFSRVNADAVKHEWQTDTLASAAQNKVAEGDDATTDAVVATVRLSNYCQISDKVPRVSGTQEAVRKAGRKSEMAYQVALRAKELKRDMENDVFSNNIVVTGSSGTAREHGGVPTWYTSNTSSGSGGSNGATGTTARTDGTQRAFTEDLLRTVLQSVWDAGGDPDCVMLGSFSKRTMSTFTGNATRNIDATQKQLITSIEVYESDWGVLNIIPNRFSRARDVHILQKDMWALAFLRPFRLQDLSKTGDSARKQLLVEYTIESRNQAASGIVADVNTS
jgi:hypothetical protein